MVPTVWLRRHRVLTGFMAGVLLILVVGAGAGYWVLSDQRRTARTLASALSRALAREVRIARVTDMATDRVVLRGVELPREGGWPVSVVVERVEATGPLVAAARGDAAPVRLTVTRPAVTLAAEGSGGLATLEGLGESLRSFLANPLLLDLQLSGGTLTRAAGELRFDLALVKERGAARGELTLRDGQAPPLVVAIQGRQEADGSRVDLEARGGLASLAGWLSPTPAARLAGQRLDVRLDIALPTAGGLVARGRAALGDAVSATGTAAFKAGVLDVTLPAAAVDLGFGAALAGLDWTPAGRAELTDVAATWPARGETRPTVKAALRVATLGLPAAGVGTDVQAERLEARLELAPAGAGLTLRGDARAGRVRAAGVELAPAETQYRLALDAGGRLGHADLEALRARVEGAVLTGTVAYDGTSRRLDGRLGGNDVDAAGLVRRLAPGWLAPADRLRLATLEMTGNGLDLRDLGQGRARLDAAKMRLERPDGFLTAASIGGRAELRGAGASLVVDADDVASTLPVVPGKVPRLSGAAVLARGPGGWRPERGSVIARDRAARELLAATLAPAASAGRLRLDARAPALERLDGLWPGVPRRLTGSAHLELEVAGDLTPGDGRLTLAIPDGELAAGKIAFRDVAADLPIRAGETGGEPPWGTLGIGELIGYGVVVRDLTTPARVWRDRLGLNQLAYVLYSGSGTGWGEIQAAFASGGPAVRGKLTGTGVRIEEFLTSYGVRGGTMTGLMRYELDYQYGAGRLAIDGRFEVPSGGTVNIELLNRIVGYAESDPTGIVRRALENLRAFDYKDAEARVQSAGNDIRVSLSLRGRERFLVFPPKVREINIRNMPLSFLARQFPGT